MTNDQQFPSSSMMSSSVFYEKTILTTDIPKVTSTIGMLALFFKTTTIYDLHDIKSNNRKHLDEKNKAMSFGMVIGFMFGVVIIILLGMGGLGCLQVRKKKLFTQVWKIKRNKPDVQSDIISETGDDNRTSSEYGMHGHMHNLTSGIIAHSSHNDSRLANECVFITRGTGQEQSSSQSIHNDSRSSCEYSATGGSTDHVQRSLSKINDDSQSTGGASVTTGSTRHVHSSLRSITDDCRIASEYAPNQSDYSFPTASYRSYSSSQTRSFGSRSTIGSASNGNDFSVSGDSGFPSETGSQ